MDLKSIVKWLKDIIIESEPPPPKVEVVTPKPAPVLPHSDSPAEPKPPTAAPAVAAPSLLDAPLSIEEVYQQAAVPPVYFTAEQVLKILDRLKDSPMDKGLTVTQHLDWYNQMAADSNAPIVTAQIIARDAKKRREALQTHAERLARQTDQFIAAKQQEINSLKTQLAAVEKEIEEAQENQARANALYQERADRLQEVEEFLDQDVSD